ncbi:hypothetical protein Pmani_020431 [Petrolisthes manimaculis]|uniref:Uncharacterized protein n=1 Tax=Petrolisthes manimaculis TaxID=1843537 RepID=A0AAE1PIP6_9EUCA|nr:hypothetical protein Pmani_020431 [Petrolisthes manimaculis]
MFSSSCSASSSGSNSSNNSSNSSLPSKPYHTTNKNDTNNNMNSENNSSGSNSSSQHSLAHLHHHGLLGHNVKPPSSVVNSSPYDHQLLEKLVQDTSPQSTSSSATSECVSETKVGGRSLFFFSPASRGGLTKPVFTTREKLTHIMDGPGIKQGRTQDTNIRQDISEQNKGHKDKAGQGRTSDTTATEKIAGQNVTRMDTGHKTKAERFRASHGNKDDEDDGDDVYSGGGRRSSSVPGSLTSPPWAGRRGRGGGKDEISPGVVCTIKRVHLGDPACDLGGERVAGAGTSEGTSGTTATPLWHRSRSSGGVS